MVWLGIAYLITCALFSVAGYILFRDREHWHGLYQARDREARAREDKLYDQLLKVKGFRLVNEPLTPQMPDRAPLILNNEDIDVMQDRIGERVELGIMTPSEALNLIQDMRTGQKSQAEIDRVLRQRQLDNLNGSVADIVG